MTPMGRLLREARVRMRATDVATNPDGSHEMDPAGNPLRRVLEGVKTRLEDGDDKALAEAHSMIVAVLA